MAHPVITPQKWGAVFALNTIMALSSPPLTRQQGWCVHIVNVMSQRKQIAIFAKRTIDQKIKESKLGFCFLASQHKNNRVVGFVGGLTSLPQSTIYSRIFA